MAALRNDNAARVAHFFVGFFRPRRVYNGVYVLLKLFALSHRPVMLPIFALEL